MVDLSSAQQIEHSIDLELGIYRVKKQTRDFISKDMKINLANLNTKLQSSEVISSAPYIHGYLDDVSKFYEDENSSSLIKKYVLIEFEKRNRLVDTSEARMVLDAFRHAFTVFSNRCVKDLYIYQENECWYPKILLDKNLDTTDLNGHPDELTIFRGCGKAEIGSGEFGQSWTLDKNVAIEFAYNHYSSQPWFCRKLRVVVEAKIENEHVYLSRVSHHEQEIVVNTDYLICVKESK